MTFPSLENIIVRQKGRIVEASFNRPDQLNAFSRQMEKDFIALIQHFSTEETSDILILTGEGRAFSAGGDLEFMQENADHPELFDITIAKQAIFGIIDCPKPIIAKVNGDVVGLGASIALFCDLIFAADTARVGDPHVRMGYSAGDGGSIIWPQLIGYARAKEYLFTGKLLGAPEAANIGLINRSVPAAELDAFVEDFATKLSKGATMAIRWTKMSVNIGLKQLATATLDASLAYEALSNMTEDHREALNAFREKRPPVFSGR